MVGKKVVHHLMMSAKDAHYVGGLVNGARIVDQWGDVQRNGHAVSAGNVLVIVEEIWLSVPCFHVNGCKCHCLCSFS